MAAVQDGVGYSAILHQVLDLLEEHLSAAAELEAVAVGSSMDGPGAVSLHSEDNGAVCLRLAVAESGCEVCYLQYRAAFVFLLPQLSLC